MTRQLLGQGWEGAVYLVQDRQTEESKVLKIFHRPVPKVWHAGLQAYARGVLDGDCPGLSPVNLVQDSGQILGLLYPYRRAYELNRRILWSFDQIGQALVGSYCRMQYYLMTQHNLGLWDVSTDNFRLDKYGQFWFIDFGCGVASLDNPVCADRGLFEYGFVMLLLSIYDVNLRISRPHTTGYEYAESSSYCAELTGLASRRDWINPILNRVSDKGYAVFVEPEFYRQIGDQFPRRVAWPLTVMVANSFITSLARLRIILRRKLLPKARDPRADD